ncbi:putative helicase senataxin [Arapaima gigas]
MSTCRWCTPVALGATELLQKYCSGELLANEQEALNEDLCFCLDCVVEYHRARDELPSLHKRLWELEISRLLARFSEVSEEELMEDDLFIVEEEHEIHLSKITGAEFENFVRVPLTEILKYPYLMMHPKLCDLCVETLCKMEKSTSFQVFEKLQGIYLLLVHPNEEVRRWAIRTARSLGKVDRDDFYDLKDIFCIMFRVLDLDLFHNPDVYSSIPENSKNALLPHHLYDAKNPKDYWLGRICMLLTQLDAHAMDSLLLGTDKQTEIIQCIVKTMENTAEDENSDPFWPSLQCFMVILDCLGSKIWGQLIEPTCPFQTITGSPSFIAEISNIRQNTMMSRVKVEVERDDMVTCSQIIYDCNIKEKKATSVRRSTNTEGSSMIYEEMQSLVNVLQLDMGKDMRVHNSTFLWFIPFVQSVMDLNNLSVVYIGEVIHYLCEEIKDLIKGRIQTCDKVTEFYTFILVFIIDLHLSKRRMNILYYSAPKWVEVIVKCAMLPSAAFSHGFDHGSPCVSSTTSSSWNPRVSTAVPQACMQIIRNLLKEGRKLSFDMKAKQFQDLLNKQIREAPKKEWNLGTLEAEQLQQCLKQLVKLMKDNHSAPASDHTDNTNPETLSLDTGNESSSLSEDCKLLLKKEPVWDNGQCKLIDLDKNHNNVDLTVVKKEPLIPDDNLVETRAEPNLPPLPSGKISDPGKLQLIKSKLGPSLYSKLLGISKQHSDSKITEGVSPELQSVLDGSSKECYENFVKCEENLDILGHVMSNVARSEAQAKNMPSSVKLDDDDNSDNIPLSVLRSQLKQKSKNTDVCEIDKGENNCPVDSSLDVSTPLRKMKQKLDRFQINSKDDDSLGVRSVEPTLDVIVISDSESTKEDDDINFGSLKETENLSGIQNNVMLKADSPNGADTGKGSSCDNGGGLSEYDSQLFEFETEDDMFSAWTDSQISVVEPDHATKKATPASSKQQLSLGTNNSASGRGYDTEPVSDENIRNVMVQLEEQQKQQSSAEPTKTSVQRTLFTIPKASPVKYAKGSTFKKKLGVRELKTEKEPKGSLNTTVLCHPSSVKTPAIVPPKKDRKPVEPVSTAEKLGLKKRERKAFELSQRSQAYVGKLRKYGQGVHIEQKNCNQRGKKSKLITPQKLNVRGHRKLLASQDLQFFRQSRSRHNSLHSKTTNEQTAGMQGPEQMQFTKIKNAENQIFKPNIADISSHRVRTAGKLLQDKPALSEMSSTEAKPTSSATIVDDDNTDWLQLSNSLRPDALIATSSTDDKCDAVDIASDDDDLDTYVTQNDPIDMEMCSQMDEEDDNIFLTQRDPVDMDIDVESQTCLDNKPEEGHIPVGAAKEETRTCTVSTSHADDQIFLKPGMSLSSLKKSKPSTTKIYAPSSRSATLFQEMEKSSSKQLPVCAKKKIVRPSFPVRNTSRLQSDSSLFQQPLPSTTSVPPQPHSFQNNPVSSSLQVPTYKSPTYTRPEAPVQAMPHNDVGPKFDQMYLIKAVLKWNYEMFCSYTQFGIPSDLCNFQLKEVANKYKSYDEYFSTFYPLLLINTFEELVSEWIKSSDAGRGRIQHRLQVTGIEYSNRLCRANFTACLCDQDAKNQQYPKEDDLVILWLHQNKTAYCYDTPLLQEPSVHFGCVSRANLISGVKNILDLTIQTYGNVSSVNNQLVKCELVGSLVNAIREFKALYMLKNNPLARMILAPHVTFFQPGLDNILNISLPDYNTEQIKAISSGLSIVRGHEKAQKICLIHGPPGTGKSRTIVGLLQKLFSEGVKNLPSASKSQARAFKLRILLCAPSNAAIDCLMKKIILVFKDSCKDRQNPQGNCGDINLVRLGIEKTISENLKPYSLDNQTRSRTRKAQQGHDADIHRREQLDQYIEVLSQKAAMEKKDPEMFKKLMDEKHKLLKEREQLSRHLREARSRKQEIQAKVLQDAHIICCTLSTSGSMVLESAFRRLGHKPFSCVIVDEAGQATETETLIPLLYRCPALILVGDPDQLPPTVVSQKAKEKKYDQSLMARLQKCLYSAAKENPQIRNPVIFLSQQYRMHPDICEFPSKYIYNRALVTDGETAQKRCAVSWPFQPYRLFDVTDGREVKDGDSFYNQKEVNLVLLMLRLIAEKQNTRVGVITPYNAQKQRLLGAIRAEMAREENFKFDVDTVDGFQGREMDCIIVSCVRASSELGSIGFLGNRQRMNVTITRAKSSLFILGHVRTLKEQKDWGALIDDACKRGTIIKTCEKDFTRDARQIFKPDGSRGFPSKLQSLSSRVSNSEGAFLYQRSESMYASTTSAGHVEGQPAPIRSHRGSDPLPLDEAKKVPASAHSSVRSPAGDRPRDPRLAAYIKQSTARPPCSLSDGHDSAVTPRDPNRLPADPAPPPPVQYRGESSHFSGFQSSRWNDKERHQQPQEMPYDKRRYRDSRHAEPDRRTSSHLSCHSSYHHSRRIKRPSDSHWSAAVLAKKGKK